MRLGAQGLNGGTGQGLDGPGGKFYIEGAEKE